jgi:hypothetical protein
MSRSKIPFHSLTTFSFASTVSGRGEINNAMEAKWNKKQKGVNARVHEAIFLPQVPYQPYFTRGEGERGRQGRRRETQGE